MTPQELVDEYARWHRREAKAKKKMAELREELLPVLRKKIPSKGPFLVTIEEAECTQFKWKSFAKRVAKELWGKAAGRRIEDAMKEAGTYTQEKLKVSANPDWEG